LEAAGVISAAVACLLAAVAAGAIAAPAWLPERSVLTALAAAGLLVEAIALAGWIRRHPGRGTALAQALLLYLGIFGLYGLAAHLLLRTVLGQPLGPSLLALTGAFAAAWIGGFFTPGAPAGLGVREALLVGLLTPQLGPEAALGLAVAFRLVTTLGDAVGFVAGLVMLRGISAPPTASTGYTPDSSGS
jgi:hypothetical protein